MGFNSGFKELLTDIHNGMTAFKKEERDTCRQMIEQTNA